MRKLEDGIEAMRATLDAPQGIKRWPAFRSDAAREWAIILAALAITSGLAYAAFVLVPWTLFIGIAIGAGIAAIPLRGLGFGILAAVLGGLFFGPIGMAVGVLVTLALLLR